MQGFPARRSLQWRWQGLQSWCTWLTGHAEEEIRFDIFAILIFCRYCTWMDGYRAIWHFRCRKSININMHVSDRCWQHVRAQWTLLLETGKKLKPYIPEMKLTVAFCNFDHFHATLRPKNGFVKEKDFEIYTSRFNWNHQTLYFSLSSIWRKNRQHLHKLCQMHFMCEKKKNWRDISEHGKTCAALIELKWSFYKNTFNFNQFKRN